MRKPKERSRILKKLSRPPGGDRAGERNRCIRHRGVICGRSTYRSEEQDFAALGQAWDTAFCPTRSAHRGQSGRARGAHPRSGGVAYVEEPCRSAKHHAHSAAAEMRLVRLTFLAPDIIASILSGRHDPDLTVSRLMADTRFPLDWNDQRRSFASA